MTDAGLSDHEKIFRAIEDKDLVAVMELHRAGCDINEKDADGDTPLNWAVSNGCLPIVKYLVSEGAPVNGKDDSFGATPLHWAAMEDRWEIAEYLIIVGADIHAKNIYDQTPLYIANFRRSWNVMEVLRKYGARE